MQEESGGEDGDGGREGAGVSACVLRCSCLFPEPFHSLFRNALISEMQPLEYAPSPIFPKTNPSDPIYLDYNATTPVDPEVAKAMWPFMTQYFGNPSSGHVYGQRLREG